MKKIVNSGHLTILSSVVTLLTLIVRSHSAKKPIMKGDINQPMSTQQAQIPIPILSNDFINSFLSQYSLCKILSAVSAQ